jgi:hypothetical protein
MGIIPAEMFVPAFCKGFDSPESKHKYKKNWLFINTHTVDRILETTRKSNPSSIGWIPRNTIHRPSKASKKCFME